MGNYHLQNKKTDVDLSSTLNYQLRRQLKCGISWSSVVSLNLSGNKLDHDLMSTLTMHVRKNTSLQSLALANTGLNSYSVYELMEAIIMSEITVLNIRCNLIGEHGACVIARYLPRTKLTMLLMWGNAIGTHGTMSIERALLQSNITHIEVTSETSEMTRFMWVVNSEWYVIVMTMLQQSLPPDVVRIFSLNYLPG
jgi:Ran GTPase-activating protein (RanGAP) involved in mRNA processing and transport